MYKIQLLHEIRAADKPMRNELAECTLEKIDNEPNFMHNIMFTDEVIFHINLLKPTGHVMHHQFNIQQLYALPTLYLCVLCLSENKQRSFPYTALNDWFL